MTGKPLDADTLALLAWCARTRAKLRHYERSGGPMPTMKQVFQECEDDERREAAETAYTAAKRRAGRTSALARRKVNPAPGVVNMQAWRRLREVEVGTDMGTGSAMSADA